MNLHVEQSGLVLVLFHLFAAGCGGLSAAETGATTDATEAGAVYADILTSTDQGIDVDEQITFDSNLERKKDSPARAGGDSCEDCAAAGDVSATQDDGDAADAGQSTCDDGDPCTVDSQLADGACELGIAVTRLTLDESPNFTKFPRYMEQHAVATGGVIYTRWLSTEFNSLQPLVAAFDRHGIKLWQHLSYYSGKADADFSKNYYGRPPCQDHGALFAAGKFAVEACNGTEWLDGKLEQVVGVNIFTQTSEVTSKVIMLPPTPLQTFEMNSTKGIGYPNGDFILLAQVRLKDYGAVDPQRSWRTTRVDAKGNVLWINELVAVGDNKTCFIERAGPGFLIRSWVSDTDTDKAFLYDAKGEFVSEFSSEFAESVAEFSDLGASPSVLMQKVLKLGGFLLGLHQMTGEIIWQTAFPNCGLLNLQLWDNGVFMLHLPKIGTPPAEMEEFAVYLDSSGLERFRKLVTPQSYIHSEWAPPKALSRDRLEIHKSWFAFGQGKNMTPENTALHILDPWGHATCAAAGVCASKTLEECLDLDPCTADDCDPKLGCTHVPLPDDATCNWSTGAKCKKGICK